MRNWFKRAVLIVIAPVAIVVVYLIAALVGGLIPASLNQTSADERLLDQPVYLIANMLHADIAIPVNTLSLQQFAFLRKAGFPLDNPELKYLIVGWGSKEFYTSTKDYSDIEFATVWQAATGDNAVMHIAPAGDLSTVDDIIPLQMSESGFARLVEFMGNYFEKVQGEPSIVAGATFGFGDVFYESLGYFHLLNPCNVWVAAALREAGLASGIWTPTTYSLLLNHYLYN